MWVRIREISFPVVDGDDVIQQVRNTAVARNSGSGYRGFRLLVDRPNGRALEVSYWETEEGAAADVSESGVLTKGMYAFDLSTVVEERCNHYELAIDAG